MWTEPVARRPCDCAWVAFLTQAPELVWLRWLPPAAVGLEPWVPQAAMSSMHVGVA